MSTATPTPTPPPPRRTSPYTYPLIGVLLLCSIAGLFAFAKKMKDEETKGKVPNPIAAIKSRLPVFAESKNPLSKLPPQAVETPVPVVTLPPVAQATPRPTPPPAPPRPAPITLYTARRQPLPQVDGTYIAPRGRQVVCRLVTTCDSGNLETPIIGLVQRAIYAPSGQILIPKGTEVHFIGAKADAARDRIAASGRWTFIIRDGSGPTARARELVIDAVALDHEYEDTTASFALTDGSAGLRGEVIRTDQWDQVLLFASTALGGLANGLKQQTQTVFGSQPTSSFPNAGLNAGSTAIESYAQQILERIKRDGAFVRVAAGKAFILYCKEPLNLSKATVTGDQLAARSVENRPTEPPQTP